MNKNKLHQNKFYLIKSDLGALADFWSSVGAPHLLRMKIHPIRQFESMTEKNIMKWLSWQHRHVILTQLSPLLLLLGMLFSLMLINVDISTQRMNQMNSRFKIQLAPTL